MNAAGGAAAIGRYQILGELGRGAMGIVYRGRDPQLERAVAIKLIRLEDPLGGSLLGDSSTLADLEARFLREARVAARVHHPGVATVYDAGRDARGFYLVMELVEGEPLSRRLGRGAFPGAAEALDLVAQVADALQAAHAAGVVHRDVKPANILCLPGGRVKVTDFGVAKAVGESTELTRSGTVLGSPAYMAPEQIQGQAVDGRADLFSLGVILYELLLRRRPFPADTVTTLIYQILHQDPFADEEVLRALGPELGAFLRACLAKQPGERVPDAAAFAAGARALAGRAAVLTRAETAATHLLAAAEAPTVARPRASTARLPALAAAAAVGVVALAAAGGAWVLLHRPPPPPPPFAGPVTAPPIEVPTEPLGLEGEPAAATPEPRPVEAATLVVPAPPVATAAPESAPPAQVAVPPPAPVAVQEQQQPVAVPSPAAGGEPFGPAVPIRIAETYECQQAAEFDLDPEKTEIWMGATRIGTSEELDGEPYRFPGPGIYDLRLVRPGFVTTRIRIVVHAEAEDEIAEVDTELRRLRRRRARFPRFP